jgi:hypothetical protein
MRAHSFGSSRTIAGLGLLLAWALSACGAPPAKAPLRQRPIDEARALKLIAESMEKDGVKADAPLEMTVSGKRLRLDVPIQGRKVGVVYLSANDVAELGEHPIAHKKSLPGDQFVFHTGTAEEGSYHFVVLYATDYQYDDNEGVQHEATIITAENKLDRDVRDFVNVTRHEEFQ